MRNPYELDRAEHDKCYEKIARDLLTGVESQETPKAVITGGQPGSGKGRLTAQAEKEMARQGGAVLVDSDRVRSYHPKHEELMSTNDRKAADWTHSDAAKWASRLTKDAIAGRQNLIIDQTSRDPNALVALTTRLKEAGYEVELRVMAVKAEISEQRIHTRYEDQKEEEGAGRFVTKEFHDTAYQGLPKSVAAVEHAKTVDVISVYDKNQKCIYVNTLSEGEWLTQPTGGQSSVEKERDRPLTPEDNIKKTAAYTRLCDQLEKRGADPTEREAMDAKRLDATQQLAAASEVAGPTASASEPADKTRDTPPQLNDQLDRSQVAVFRIDDLSTAAFEDLGRTVELGQVLSNAADRINGGEQPPFDLNDTNGNKVGHYEVVPANSPPATPVGGAMFTVDLNQPAFGQDRNAQLSQYLTHAADNIYRSDAGTKTVIPAADGQAMGALHVGSAAPAPAVVPVAENQHGVSSPTLSM